VKDVPVLEVENFSAYFHQSGQMIKAVDDISFRVYPAGVTALVGESGCGKTVTALSVLGLLKARGAETRGAIRLKGRNLRELTGEELRRLRGKQMAMIFQDPQNALNPVLKVETQVMEAIACHQRISGAGAREMALGLLSRVGLADPRGVLAKYPFQLSGGMCQRVMIAIAFALNPDLLIADEPTTALDVTVQAQILAELRRLKDESGAGIMLITHDLGVVAEIADLVCVMKEGKIVESGTVFDIFQNPRHSYTKKLLNSVLAV